MISFQGIVVLIFIYLDNVFQVQSSSDNYSKVISTSAPDMWRNYCNKTKMWRASVAIEDILYDCLLILHVYARVCVCVCVLWACASRGLCQLRTAVCRTVILSNGLSLPTDVLFSAPQLHPTCFHAARQCSYILFSLQGALVLVVVVVVVADSLSPFARCSIPPLHPEYCSSALAILGPEMSPVG